MTSSYSEKIAKVKDALENVFIKKTDIKNNLTSTDTDKPLSANQGKELDAKKVDKITNKGLSTNDFTNTYKGKLDNLDTNLANKSNVDHTHGNLQSDGTIGTTNNTTKNVVTDGNGKITTEDKPQIDNTVTQSSSNAVKSSGIYSALQTKQGDLSLSSGESDGFGNSIFNNDGGIFSGVNDRIYHDYGSTNELHFIDSNENDVNFDDIILEGDSRLTNARTPTSHTHGKLENDGKIKINGTAQTNKNVVTDSNGEITTEEAIVFYSATLPTASSSYEKRICIVPGTNGLELYFCDTQ